MTLWLFINKYIWYIITILQNYPHCMCHNNSCLITIKKIINSYGYTVGLVHSVAMSTGAFGHSGADLSKKSVCGVYLCSNRITVHYRSRFLLRSSFRGESCARGVVCYARNRISVFLFVRITCLSRSLVFVITFSYLTVW